MGRQQERGKKKINIIEKIVVHYYGAFWGDGSSYCVYHLWSGT